jgi:hypothetical protein
VSLISLKMDFGEFKTNKVKLYLKSTEVPGWNEIDAVGLLDAAGKLQWATKAEASSSYADRSSRQELTPDINALVERGYVDQRWLELMGGQDPRMAKMEQDIQQLKAMVQKLVQHQAGPSDGSPDAGSRSPKLQQNEEVHIINQLRKENADLRDQLQRVETMLEEFKRRVR